MRQGHDITGHTFGRLKVVSQEISTITGSKGVRWVCQCECGNKTSVRATALRHGQIKSCGCWRLEASWSNAERNLEGARFGRLTAKFPTKDSSGRRAWHCACDCGRVTVVRTGLLSSGNTKSCGCGRIKQKSHDRVVLRREGVYAVWFNTGLVKFGRTSNIQKRFISYRREALLAGGATLYAAFCAESANIERALLADASAKFKQHLYEVFSGISRDEALAMLCAHSGVEFPVALPLA